jgi:hypothetical protein
MKRNRIFTPPTDSDKGSYVIQGVKPLNLFLGGTIDNGFSLDWQKTLINELNSEDTKRPIMIYNPRRDEWNSKEELESQIRWELYHLERADIIVMNILGSSKSPISLMELGLHARNRKLLVFCPPSFYRFDNVRVTCEYYNIPLFETNDILVIKNKVLKHANTIDET